MPSYAINPGDWFKVAIIAFVAIHAINYGLGKVGKPEFAI